MTRRWFLPLATSLCLALLVSGCAATRVTFAPADPLATFNATFRAAYGEARARALAAAGPVIIVQGDALILLRDGQRTEADIRVPAYHALKAVAHVPLAVYVTLAPGDGPLDTARRVTLEQLRRLVVPARDSLAGRGFAPAALARQERIVGESLAFMDAVLARGRYGRAELRAFARGMAPLVLANATEAARASLDRLHAQATSWRRELTPAEWARVHVVIIAAHMPREGELSLQYFTRLLGEPGEGRRIVYAESLWEEKRALDLLATHLLDGDAASAFFDDPLRLHRDLLSDAVREYVPMLLAP